MNDSIRLVRKRFRCYKCNEYESKLVRPGSTRNPCSICQGVLSEVNEKEYQLHKKKVSSNGIKTTKSIPVKPTREHYKEHYENSKQSNMPRHSTSNVVPGSDYKRPPSNNNDSYNRSGYHASSSINQNESKKDSQQGRGRYQSNDYRHNNRRYNNADRKYSSGYNDNDNYNNRMEANGHDNKEYDSIQANRQREVLNPSYNSSNSHPMDSNGFHLNTIYRNFFNQDNIGGGRQGGGQRMRSVEPTVHIHNPNGVFVIRSSPNYMPMPFGGAFFQDFFGEQAIHPFMQQPQMFSMPFRIRVRRHNFDEGDIFDPEFASFGSTLNGFFLDNFASNFRSNWENAMFEQLISAIQDNLLQAESRKSKKTKKEALQSLKRFDMTEKYCKKGKSGKLEQPNCCICLSDIAKGENTVLLPCGHMFHWKCCHSWLKDNNTCPVCRFELPAENGDNEKGNL